MNFISLFFARIFSESSSSGSQTAMPAGVDQVGVAGGRSLEASNAAKAEEHSPFSEEQLSKVYITDRDFVVSLFLTVCIHS